MENQTRFSIVIPVYNAEKYVTEMIESVISQTYSNWELIIMDDGSTDSSGIICDRYASEKVKVYHNENQGQMLARINGINKATGDYTLVVDADDVLKSECLELVDQQIIKGNYDMVMFPYVLYDENLEKRLEEVAGPEKVRQEMTREEVLHWVITTYNHGLVNKAVRTSLIQKGASEAITEKLSVNGDYALIVPILCNIRNAIYIDDVLYLYRIYGGSISHNYRVKHIGDTVTVTEKVMSTLKRYGCCSPLLEKAVYKTFLYMMAWMTEGVVAKGLLHKADIEQIRERSFFIEAIQHEKEIELTVIQKLKINVLKKNRRIEMFWLKLLVFFKKGISTIRK